MKKFTRTRENFICGNCGTKVVGTGYTNHCTKCLWSRHVDINPGDRLETCGGFMEPIAIEFKSGEHQILHRCTICGKEKKNKVAPGDSMTSVIEVAQKASGT